MKTVIFLLNQALKVSVKGKTPYEAWHNRKPNVHWLPTFGCIAHVKVSHPNLKMLDDHSTPMIFVGYENGSKTYKAYDPMARCVHITRDVVFNETTQWDWSHNNEDMMLTSLGEVFHFDPILEKVATPENGSVPLEAQTSSPTPINTPPPAHHEVHSGYVTPPENATPSPPDEGPRWYRSLEAIYEDALEEHLDPAELYLTAEDEPTMFSEENKLDCLCHALQEELKSIEENST